MQVMQNQKKTETVLTCCFTTLDTAAVYCPMILIQTLLQRDFFFTWVSLLNKKLVTISQTYYDRRLLLLCLISLIRFTVDSKEMERLDHGAVFRFLVLLMDYHMYMSNSLEASRDVGLTCTTRIGNLQKDIIGLRLVQDTGDGDVEDYMKEEDIRGGSDEDLRKRANHSDDDDSDDDDRDSLYASDDSNDFKNHDFDVRF